MPPLQKEKKMTQSNQISQFGCKSLKTFVRNFVQQKKQFHNIEAEDDVPERWQNSFALQLGLCSSFFDSLLLIQLIQSIGKVSKLPTNSKKSGKQKKLINWEENVPLSLNVNSPFHFSHLPFKIMSCLSTQ